MKRISLRQLRDTLPEITEVVEVHKRDPEGNHIVLGYWTPYMTYPPDAKPLEPLRHVEDVDDLGPDLDDFALRATNQMPPLQPGTLFVAGKAVMSPKPRSVEFNPVPKPARKK